MDWEYMLAEHQEFLADQYRRNRELLQAGMPLSQVVLESWSDIQSHLDENGKKAALRNAI